MARCIFCWPNHVDDPGVAFSGGSWVATLPLANLATDPLYRVARSTDDATASTTFDVDLGTARTINVVAIPRHNLQSAATIRVRGSTVANFASTVYDSGVVDVWPEQWPPNVLPAGHPNAATRKLTNAQIAQRRWAWTHVLPAPAVARYWRLDIDDTTNTDGYVQLHRLVLSPGYQPSVNPKWGFEFGFESETIKDKSLGGSYLFDERATRRVLRGGFATMHNDEALAVLQEMKLELGLAKQVFFIHDPADTYHMARRSFLCTFRELSPMSYDYHLYRGAGLILEEVL
jgi:hypothetical protein